MSEDKKRPSNEEAWEGFMQETAGDNPLDEATGMRVASKEDVWHLIQRGMLLTLHFDMETFGLERDFAQISSYGDALGDIAGNLIDWKELDVKRPDRYLPDIHALEVTRTMPQELDEPDRLPHRIAMGQIAERFESSVKRMDELPLEATEVTIATYTKRGKAFHEKTQAETVIEYPLRGENGEIVNDVRYHPDRKRISYRVDSDPASPYYENPTNNFYKGEDGSVWKFVEPRLLVSGFNIKRADLTWIRANLVKAGFHPSNIFFAYSRSVITNKERPKNFASDAMHIVQATHAFGPQGEDGVKIGKRFDPRRGEEVPSVALSRVMEANTRFPNPQRGIEGGVKMPDGTLYDEQQAHRSPAYDALASFSIYNYAREHAPEVVSALELQADEQELRRFLPGADHDTPPIFAMLRNSYPMSYPLSSPVTTLGFDDQLGQMRKAIMIRLDINLKGFTFKGKNLEQMDEHDFADMIQEQARTHDQLVRAESLRRWPGVVRLEDALKSGGGGEDWDFEDVDDNFRYLVEHPDVCERIRGGVEIVNHRTSHRADPSNPMMEEQGTRNGFGDLDYLSAQSEQEKRRRLASGRGTIPSIVETLYNKAMDIFNYHRIMDAQLHRLAIQPHPIEWSDGEEALANFHDLLKRIRRKLNEKDSPYKSVMEDDFVKDFLRRYKPGKDHEDEDVEAFLKGAREFRWKLSKRLLEDDAAERGNAKSPYAQNLFDRGSMDGGRVLFADLSRDFRVVDKKGREMPLDYIKEQHARDPNAVLKKLEKGDWKIQFYRLSSNPSIAATLFQFADMDKMDMLPERWRKEYDALRGHYLYGPPNTDPGDHRWPTIPRLERDIARLEVNSLSGRDDPEIARIFNEYAARGEADQFMRHDESQRILAATRQMVDEVKEQFPLRDDFRRAANFDPDSGLPYDWIAHELDSRKIVVIDVPDTHLRRPLDHIAVSSPYSLVVPQLSDEQKKKIRSGAEIVLRGEQTGRRYYAGPASVIKAPAAERGLQDYYTQAERAYEDAGSTLPPEREILVIEAPKPLAQTRRNIDPDMQAVKVPSQFFDALVSPRIAHMTAGKPLTGLVLPVDYVPQEPEADQPIRFLDMDAPLGAKLNGTTAKDTGHTYESVVRDVQRMTVAELKDIDVETAQRNGFASPHEMWEQTYKAFLRQESADPSLEEIYVLKFDKVKKSSWAYFNPSETPEAAVVYGGQPVPPSAYRPKAVQKRASL